MTPLISVVLPVRNPGAFLPDSIGSVRVQNLEDWELLIVDDGSKDPIDRFIPNDSRIKLYRCDPIGVSAARNFGITHSTGKYIAFIDSDDLWFPEKLTLQTKIMESNEAVGMCFTERNVIDADGLVDISRDYNVVPLTDAHPGLRSLNAETVLYERDANYADLGALNYVSNTAITTSTVMLRRSILPCTGLFDVMLKFGEDYDLWLKCARVSSIAHLMSTHASYRWHANNSMHNYVDGIFYDKQMYQKYWDYADTKCDVALSEACMRALNKSHRQYGPIAYDRCRVALREKDLKGFFQHFIASVMLDPRHVANSLGEWLNMRTQSL